MRALQVRFSLDFLLESVGIERGNINVVAAKADNNVSFVLTLMGEDERLPEWEIGEVLKTGIIAIEKTIIKGKFVLL